jgi:hypothetical protein
MEKEELPNKESLNSNELRDYAVGSILKPLDKDGNPHPFTFKVNAENSVLVEFNESDRIKPWGRDIVYIYFQKMLATFIKERSKEKENITFNEKTVNGDFYSVRYSVVIESETVEEAINKSNALRFQINWIVYQAMLKSGLEKIKKQKLNIGNIVEDFNLRTCPD